VDTIKQAIFGRLRIASGPEALRFPKHLDEEYFAQLTAEKIVTKYHKGFPRREWIKIRPRNEALDCLVYSLAALSSLNIRDWKRLQRTAKVVETVEETVAQPEPQPQRRALKPARRPQSWIQRF
jgi:phage terminase large subunit GpA-like protein